MEYFKNYTTTLIGTMIVLIIIKMIAPEGKNKKYILFVCGMITTVAMMQPLLELMNLDLNEVLAKNEITYEEYKADNTLYQKAIQNSYEKNLVEDIIKRLKENGYHVDNVRIEYDKQTFQPEKVYLDLDLTKAYLRGYLEEMADNLTPDEINYLGLSIKVLTYELTIRFLTDYLNGDTYFKVKYPEHNRDRFLNQYHLLMDVESKLPEINRFVNETVKDIKGKKRTLSK